MLEHAQRALESQGQAWERVALSRTSQKHSEYTLDSATTQFCLTTVLSTYQRGGLLPLVDGPGLAGVLLGWSAHATTLVVFRCRSLPLDARSAS